MGLLFGGRHTLRRLAAHIPDHFSDPGTPLAGDFPVYLPSPGQVPHEGRSDNENSRLAQRHRLAVDAGLPDRDGRGGLPVLLHGPGWAGHRAVSVVFRNLCHCCISEQLLIPPGVQTACSGAWLKWTGT